MFKVRKMNRNLASKVTYNANIYVEVETKEVQLQRTKPVRPSQLRLKTEHYYDVKLPTYEESRNKYVKFMKLLLDDLKRVATMILFE